MFVFRRSAKRIIVSAMTIALLLSTLMVQPAYAAAPTVVSVTRGGASGSSAAGVVSFTVTFSEPVKGVDLTDFEMADASVADAYIIDVTGVDGDTVYTVNVNTGTGTGTVGVNVLADGTITNMADELLAGSYSSGELYLMEYPFVVSITKLDADPTSKASVRFQVTFSDAVVGVNKGTNSDFTLATTGTAGATITGLTGSGTTYTVTVKTALGNGTLGLNLVDDDTIQGPDGGRVLGGAGTGGIFTGEVYTVKKIPVPKTPGGTVYDTTPKFTWTPIPRATSYQFQVFRGASTTPLYTLAVAPTACTATLCTKTPATVLLPAAYKWRVAAKIDGAWKPYSAKKSFTTVVGFNSQFNGSAPGWVKRPGAAWNISGGAYYGTDGLVGKVSSASYNQKFSNFTYEARMQRVGTNDNYGGEVGLIVRGTPLFTSINDWKTAYMFLYSSYYRKFTVVRGINGSYVWIGWHSSSAIVQNGWNTLKVIASGTNFKYYINGTLAYSSNIPGISSGQAGLWSYGGASTSRLDVDWAKLVATAPYSSPSALSEQSPDVQWLPLPSGELPPAGP